MFNVTTRTIVAPTKALSYGLQPIDSQCVLHQLEIDTHGLTEEEVKESYECILRFKYVFAKNDQDLGLSSRLRHQISSDLVSVGVIRPSHSPWASNVVLAR